MNNKYIDSGRTNQKLETRCRILDSAQYYLNNGLEFNLEDIAKRTGISRATVYRYFSSADVLAAEAGLDVSTQSPESIYQNLRGVNIEEKVLEIQEYYNALTLDNENLFRKYISAVLDTSTPTSKRGARRKKTLELVLKDTSFTQKEREDLSNLLTLFMGMEPYIVTKDVCGLNNEESSDLLKWGVSLIFKGFIDSKK